MGKIATARWMVLTISLLFASALNAAHADPRKVLPPASAVKGWKQVGKARVYNPNNLFDLIDGEAEAVKAYHFVSCAHAEYAPAPQSRPVLTIDVFEMGDPLDAFGLFGSDRRSGSSTAIGAEGIKIAPSGLNFWKGRYVVRTTIVQVSPANQAAQLAFAKAAAARITGSSARPATVAALPPGRQPRSENYVRSNVAGHQFIANAVVASYPSLGQGAQLFIAQYPSPTAAKAALEAYRAYEKSGTGLRPLSGLGAAAFTALDRYAKNVVVAQKGRYLVGMHHARDAVAAQKLVKQALAKVH